MFMNTWYVELTSLYHLQSLESVFYWAVCPKCYWFLFGCIQRKEKLEKQTEDAEKKKANYSAGKMFGVSINSIQFKLFININTSNTTVQYQIKIMLKGETDRREHNSL